MDIIDQLKFMEAGKVGPYPRDETLRLARGTIERLRQALKTISELVDEHGYDNGAQQIAARALEHMDGI